jgi:HEAT repeat protein
MSTPRLLVRLLIALVLLSAAAVVIPGSPVYLPKLHNYPQHDGHSTRYWLKAVDSSDPELRYHALYCLGAIGTDAGEAVPKLAQVMRADPDPSARSAAALSLSKMAPASRVAVKELAESLSDDEALVRMNAAIALSRLHADARPAIPALIKAINDEDNLTNLHLFSSTIQEMSVIALGRASAGSPEAVPALTEALAAAETEPMRAALARALGEVGAEAKPALPLLRVMRKNKSPWLREVAEEVLQKIGDTADGSLASDTLATSVSEPELPEAERKYLWEIEHHGNLLVKHGFGPLAAAIKAGNAKALNELMAADFAGADLRKPRRVAANDYADVERLEEAGHSPISLNQFAFVNRLLEFRKSFAESPPGVKLALMALSPKIRGQFDGRWEGTAQLRLHGEWAKGAPAEVIVLLRFEILQPTEEVLSKPGWLRAAGVSQVRVAKAPKYLFAEVARERGLQTAKLHDNWTAAKFEPTPGGVYVCDFNRDGILDILITDVSGNALYRGRPDGTFEDVTEQSGIPRQSLDSTVAAWIDIDGDGWEDLILGGRIYRNETGQRFTDYTTRSNLRLPLDAGGIVVADYDRDGKLDLYVTRSTSPGGQSWLEGRSGDPKGNYLFRNLGDWQFKDVTKISRAGSRGRSTFSAAWLDANNDGWPDLHVINEFGDGVLLINNGDGTFSEQPLADRPADFGSMGIAVGDINNDGNIDIYCANMYSKAGSRVIGNLAPDSYAPAVQEKMRRFVAGSQLHLNKGGLKFEQVGKKMQVAAVGWAYGACLADLDNDGWLDIYATAGYFSRDRNEPDG